MRDKIKDILEKHELLRLATLDKSGFPNVRSVDFAIDQENESHIYFTTFNKTRKVAEIAEDNRVYVVVDKPAMNIEELAQVKYIRANGKAFKVEMPEEMQKAMGLLIQKYPFIQELPGDPSMMSIYRIELNEVEVTDNSLGFGHVDKYSY